MKLLYSFVLCAWCIRGFILFCFSFKIVFLLSPLTIMCWFLGFSRCIFLQLLSSSFKGNKYMEVEWKWMAKIALTILSSNNKESVMHGRWQSRRAFIFRCPSSSLNGSLLFPMFPDENRGISWMPKNYFLERKKNQVNGLLISVEIFCSLSELIFFSIARIHSLSLMPVLCLLYSSISHIF